MNDDEWWMNLIKAGRSQNQIFDDRPPLKRTREAFGFSRILGVQRSVFYKRLIKQTNFVCLRLHTLARPWVETDMEFGFSRGSKPSASRHPSNVLEKPSAPLAARSLRLLGVHPLFCFFIKDWLNKLTLWKAKTEKCPHRIDVRFWVCIEVFCFFKWSLCLWHKKTQKRALRRTYIHTNRHTD